ncbi:MAG: DUF2339 domain-containing protein [Pseudomonadota bacterium]
MAWLGMIAGIVFGIFYSSWGVFLWLSFIGWLIVYLLKLWQTHQHAPSHSQLEELARAQQQLEHQFNLLHKKIDQLTQRVGTLESQAFNLAPAETTFAHSPAASVQPPAPPPPSAIPLSTPQLSPTSTSASESTRAQTFNTLAEIHVPIPLSSHENFSSEANNQIDHKAVDPVLPKETPKQPLVSQSIETTEPSWLNIIWQRWIMGGNPMVKIGVVILFLGLAFLLRYAAEHAVLPVELRYAAVAATGIGLLVFGWRWRTREDRYGLILQGAGIGVMYLTTLAAMKLHPLIPPTFGFSILVSVAIFAAMLAILQDALALAVAAALGGFATPVLASTGGGHHVAFFSYLTLLNLGIVAIAWFKAWRLLNAIGFICTFMLGSAWAAKHYQPELYNTTEPFVLLMFVVYVLITFLFARRTLAETSESNEPTLSGQFRQAVANANYIDGLLVFGVPFASFTWQYLLVKTTEIGSALSALGFGFFYIILAFLLFQRSGRRTILLTETLIALGVIFGSLAIPLGLEEKWTSAAWAIEAAGMYWLGIRQQKVHARLFALLLWIGSLLVFVFNLHAGHGSTVIEGSLLGAALLAIGSGWIFWLIRQANPSDLHAIERALPHHIARAGAFFAALMPFLLWPMEWAAPALALMGSGIVFAAFRLPEHALLYWGYCAQILAGILFVIGRISEPNITELSILSVPFQHSGFWGALFISLAGFLGAYLLQRAEREHPVNRLLGWAALGWSGLWWSFTWHHEIVRVVPDHFMQSIYLLLIILATTWCWSTLALYVRWKQIGQATLAYLPVLILLALREYLFGNSSHLLIGWGVLVWPLALLTHSWLIRCQSAWLQKGDLELSHSAGIWLFVALGASEIRWHFAQWGDSNSAWPLLGWIILPTAYLWAVIHPRLQKCWPICDYRSSYLKVAAFPIVLYLLGWIWLSNSISPGNASPLPYFPLLNPLEIAHMAVLLSVAVWWKSVCIGDSFENDQPLAIGIAGSTALAMITGIVLRTCHHWGEVPWNVSALIDSSLVQTSLSIVWSIVAIATMVSVNRHKKRWVWITGAGLMAIVVIKLFLVELANTGSLARIVSFIVVGILLLFVGYIAPLPPKQTDKPTRNES